MCFPVNFTKFLRTPSVAASALRCSMEEFFYKISQNSQENIGDEVFFNKFSDLDRAPRKGCLQEN